MERAENALKLHNQRDRIGTSCKHQPFFPMPANPSRTIPVIIGFFLCLFLMCVISLTAFWMLRQTSQMVFEQSRNTNVMVGMGQVLRQFDTALIAALQYRETNEKQYADEVMGQIRKTVEETAELEMSVYTPESNNQLRKLRDMCEQFARCFAEDWETGEKIRVLGEEWRRHQEIVLNSLEKLTELQKEFEKNDPNVAPTAGRALMGEVRESMLQIALLRQSLASFDRQVADAARQELQQKWNQARLALDTIDQNVAHPEMKKTVQETVNQSTRLIEATQMWADLHAAQQALRQQQDIIANKTRDIGEEIQIVQDKHLNIHAEEMHRMISMLSAMLGVCSFVAVGLGIMICIVVVALVNRKSEPAYSEGFATSAEPSGGSDMRIVADRLQEVVNLLRK